MKSSVNTLEHSACDELVHYWSKPDPYDYDPATHSPLQMAALRERFAERRLQLKVLDQRAGDIGATEIATLDDLVPLLFSHTTYKSYPASFVEKGRWPLMTRWLGTLSTQPTDNVDLTGVTNVDEWCAALQRAGHYIITSSGTTGLTSYINRTDGDPEVQRQVFVKLTEVSCGLEPGTRFPYFWGGPDNGWNMGGATNRLMREIYGKPGEIFAISQQDVSVAELDRLAMTRKAMVDGSATPGMIADVQRESEDRMAAVERDMEIFFDRLFSYRDQDIYLFAGASTLWRIVEAGRKRGLTDGVFGPGSIIFSGGGMKGFRGPADYLDEVQRFFGMNSNRLIVVYGMAELNTQFYRCPEGHYHVPPTAIPLMLDRTGETLLNPSSGSVEGRGGFFDISLQGRWGGVITGDRLTMNFSPCACGRKSPSVTAVARYKDLPDGDDKLTCAGQIDSYVRGIAAGGD